MRGGLIRARSSVPCQRADSGDRPQCSGNACIPLSAEPGDFRNKGMVMRVRLSHVDVARRQVKDARDIYRLLLADQPEELGSSVDAGNAVCYRLCNKRCEMLRHATEYVNARSAQPVTPARGAAHER